MTQSFQIKILFMLTVLFGLGNSSLANNNDININNFDDPCDYTVEYNGNTEASFYFNDTQPVISNGVLESLGPYVKVKAVRDEYQVMTCWSGKRAKYSPMKLVSPGSLKETCDKDSMMVLDNPSATKETRPGYLLLSLAACGTTAAVVLHPYSTFVIYSIFGWAPEISFTSVGLVAAACLGEIYLGGHAANHYDTGGKPSVEVENRPNGRFCIVDPKLKTESPDRFYEMISQGFLSNDQFLESL